MSRFFAAIFVFIICIACASLALARPRWKPKKVEVSGTIMIVHDYCGGARPSEQQMDPPPYAVKGTKLYIRFASNPNRIIDSAVTDSAGNFKVNLVRGDYWFVEKWKTEPFVVPFDTKYEKWDTACYRKLYNTYDHFLSVKNPVSGVKITLRRRCAWTRQCVQYSGPMPGVAPPVNRSGNQPGHQE